MKVLERLQIWTRSMEFVTTIYEATATYPRSELFGLTDQTRRAACSISLNIAEGAGSGSKAEFKRFLLIAFRSCYEVTTALRIASNLDYLKPNKYNELLRELDQISAMSYIQKTFSNWT